MLTSIGILLLLAFALGIPAGIIGYGYLLRDLPSPDNIATRDTFKTARILDRNGRLLYEIIDPQGGRRTVVPLSNIAKPLQLATIAVEDASFYVNPGFDVRGIARAVWLNLRDHQVVSGASTITQQLVKNALLNDEFSIQRKVKEAVLAWEVSRRYSKEQILEMYLNEIYYGNMAYGVEAAAQTYFGKPAETLDLAESALLAGLVQSPAEHDPWTNLAAAKDRQGVVLDLMVKSALISANEADAARQEKLGLRRRSEAMAVPLKAPHFAMYVRDLVEKTYGRSLLYHGGLEIRTTLDLDLQEMAEQAITEHLAKIKQLNATNAALVAIDPNTGEIRAMVGSADYFDDSIDGQVNIALSKRQPGSTLKPFVYLTAFVQGYTPASILQDVSTTFPGGYQPQNHDKKFHGPVSIRQALANSLNVPAVKMLQTVGMDDALATMHRMGITDLTDPQRYGLTLALGGGEVKLLDLTFAYAPFASGGFQAGLPVTQRQRDGQQFAPTALLDIKDGSGKAIYHYDPPVPVQVVDPQLAYLVTNILADDKARAATYGRHSFLELSRPAAAKTGTTDDFRDGWTVGYTPELVTGVWVGNADNSPMRDVYGVTGAGYIWHNFMEQALKRQEPRDFVRPQGIQEAKVCAETGQPPAAGCREIVVEVFANGFANGFKEIRGALSSPSPTGTTAWQVGISAPLTNTKIFGMVDVIGSAVAPGSTTYRLDFAAAGADSWKPIVTNRPLSVEKNLLGRWDTTSLAPGVYSLRLTVSNGGNAQTALAQISVAPPAVTPSATITATRTITVPTTTVRVTGTVIATATISPTVTRAAPTATAKPPAKPAATVKPTNTPTQSRLPSATATRAVTRTPTVIGRR